VKTLRALLFRNKSCAPVEAHKWSSGMITGVDQRRNADRFVRVQVAPVDVELARDVLEVVQRPG
jgi:hypothetical protein